VPEQVITEEAPTVNANVAGTRLAPATDHTLIAPNASRESLIVSANVADVWLAYGTGAAAVGMGHCVRAAAPPFVEKSWKGAVHAISTGAAVVGYTELELAVGDDQGEEPTGAQAFVPGGASDAPIPAPTAPPPGTPEF
jgi:hypothetical protein